MTQFEFAFTLLGFVLGLAVAEVLGGFVRVLKARTEAPTETIRIRIGWQTPMLGLIVTLDLIAFWWSAWVDRAGIPVTFLSLIYAAAIAGIYYAAAALVFPSHAENWPNLDDWFMRHKAQVATGILAANLLLMVGERVIDGHWFPTNISMYSLLIYLAAAAALIFARRPWQNLGALIVLLGTLASLAARPFL
jgi:hypothetical protein